MIKQRMRKKKILITGAGSGLGKGTALQLAKSGHEVIACVELLSQVTALRAEAKKNNITLTVEQINILDPRDCAFAWKFDDIDVLYNNAGISEAGTISEIPLVLVRKVFETNVFANLEFTQGFIKNMVKRKKGKIIFVSSVAGFIGGPLTGAYVASKHALEGIAGLMSDELAPFGIQVATINPGPFDTGFNDRMMETIKKWYDPEVNFIDQANAVFPFPQFDPQEMIDKMVEVAENDQGLYRNICPAAYIDLVKNIQAEAWTKKQNDLLP
jgi:short-subunit dehydrogenase